MSEEDARAAAKEGAAYLAELIALGVPPGAAAEITARWVAAKTAAEVLKSKPQPKEPWQQ